MSLTDHQKSLSLFSIDYLSLNIYYCCILLRVKHRINAACKNGLIRLLKSIVFFLHFYFFNISYWQVWMLQWKAWTLTEDLRTPTWGPRLEDSDLRTPTWGLRLEDSDLRTPTWLVSVIPTGWHGKTQCNSEYRDVRVLVLVTVPLGLNGFAWIFSGLEGFAWISRGLQGFAEVCRGWQGFAGVSCQHTLLGC